LASTVLSAKQYAFRHYSNTDGLSNNTILCMLQDNMGFLWFGTKDGLNRFDGYQFKYFQNNPDDSSSLINNMITALCQDSEGLIWVGTPTGLCLYNPFTDRFIPLGNKENRIPGIIYSIVSDLSGNVWVSNRKALYRYNKKERRLYLYQAAKYFEPFFVCCTGDGHVWVSATNGNLYKYLPRNNSFKPYPVYTGTEIAGAKYVSKITDAGAKGLLIASNHNDLGLFNPNTGTSETLITRDGKGREMVIRDFMICNNTEIWIASETGIHIYDLKVGFLRNMRKIAYDPFSLSNNAVRSITQDREGGIWVGTFNGGLNYLPNLITPFENYYPNGQPGSIKGNVVRQITADKYGSLWIGTEDDGLNQFNPANGQFNNYLQSTAENTMYNMNIQGLTPDGQFLWIATFDNGIYMFNVLTKKVEQHLTKEDKKSGLHTNSFITLLKTSRGDIYAGSRTGLYILNRETKKMHFLDQVAPGNFIHMLYEDSKGIIWIGTYGSGLYRYNPLLNLFEHYVNRPSDTLSISSDWITSVYEDQNNDIWISTEGNGMCYFNRENQTFQRYGIKNGLPCGILCSFLEDQKGMLWISSTQGIICFNPETHAVKVYKKEDGLIENQFLYNSAFKDHDGRMYFGTINGFVSFNPADFRNQTYFPPVYITGFQVSGKDWKPHNKKSFNKAIINTRDIRLRYKESSFSIDFVAPSYTNPLNTRYRFRMDGTSQDWIYLPTNRRVYYTGLAPGNYRFRVATLTENDDWGKQDTVLSITIASPVWASIPAFIFYSVLLFLVLYFLYRFYLRKKQLEHQGKLASLENAKEKEILNAKISFFTNITHEVRTPLTLIKAPLDRILEKGNMTGKDMENLSIMKRNTDRLFELTNQLLDFRKTEKDRLRLNYTHTDVCVLLRNTFERFTPAAADKNIDFNLRIDMEHCYVSLDKETMIKILSNLLTNALKFTRDMVTILLEPGKPNIDSLQIRVNSNGKIIPREFREKIFEPFFQLESNKDAYVPRGTGLGLPLARSLAELHHGRLFLDTEIKDLNSFVLQISLNPKHLNAETEQSNLCLQVEMPDEAVLSQENMESADSRPLILVVDDEVDLCRFISNELAAYYRIIKCYDGSEAVDKLKKHTVNLVISDVLMPVMDGYELCNFIKSNLEFSHIPVILLTASIDFNARIEGLESGADAYIEKPFTMELILAQISNIFNNRNLACENFMRSPLINYKTVAVNNVDKEFMRRLHDVILKYLEDSELSVENVAGNLGMSVSTLYRKVKALSELNTIEYIRLFRLKKAAEMLTSNEYRINEVSYLVGFSSSSYFATSFQKQFGMTPSEFIRQQKERMKKGTNDPDFKTLPEYRDEG
jgi:signal transduction histidine kinase/ligand-binding sensor domain-containing protein/DNA-binding response OmpR family regulator